MRGLLFFALLALFSAGSAAEQDGAPLFAAHLLDLGGKTVALADYRGKPLVINFWARWCAPCREEIPELQRLWQAQRASGLVVIGIALEDDQPSVHDFVKAYEMDYPVLLAGAQGIELMKALGNAPAGLPFSLAVDRGGKVAFTKLGGMAPADLAAALAAARR